MYGLYAGLVCGKSWGKNLLSHRFSGQITDTGRIVGKTLYCSTKLPHKTVLRIKLRVKRIRHVVHKLFEEEIKFLLINYSTYPA